MDNRLLELTDPPPLNGSAYTLFIYLGWIPSPNKDVMHRTNVILDLTKARRDHAWVHKTEINCERTLVAYDI